MRLYFLIFLVKTQAITQKQKQSNTSTIVDSQSIRQELVTGVEPNASVAIKKISGLARYEDAENDGNVIGQLGSSYGAYYLTEGNASIDLTYSNLSNWNYKGQKIASVSYHLDISPNISLTAARNAYTVNGQFLNTNFPSKAYFAFSNDPSRGFELFGVKAIAKITAYYADGTPVSFQNGTAYLSVGSLNNYMNTLASVWSSDNHYSTNGSSIESTQVINGGQAVGLSGSTVTAHANGWLYSDEPNSIADHSLIPGAHTSWSSNYHYDGHYGNWDSNGSGSQYVGAGLVRLQGPELTIQIGTIDKGIDPTATYRNWMWWNTSSVIPKTPDTIIHYHYDVF